MLQFNNLTIADRDSMHSTQKRLNLTNGQTHQQMENRNQAGESDSNTPLTHDLFLQIY
jgi:hypothetical protein